MRRGGRSRKIFIIIQSVILNICVLSLVDTGVVSSGTIHSVSGSTTASLDRPVSSCPGHDFFSMTIVTSSGSAYSIQVAGSGEGSTGVEISVGEGTLVENTR